MAIREQALAVECVTRATEPPAGSGLPQPSVRKVGGYSAGAEWELTADQAVATAGLYQVEVEVEWHERGAFTAYAEIRIRRSFDHPADAERWIREAIGYPSS